MKKTATLPLRRRKHDLVREEILRSASVLFAARGYRAVTTDDIADAIGLTKSAMYYYFKSKYELLSTIFHVSFEHYLTQARAIAANDAGPVENLRRLIKQHAINVMEMREWTTIYFREESELTEKDRLYVARSRREYGQLFGHAYAVGVRKGVFKDTEPMLVVNGIIGACNSIVLWYREDGVAAREQFADKIVDLIAHGYERSADANGPRRRRGG